MGFIQRRKFRSVWILGEHAILPDMEEIFLYESSVAAALTMESGERSILGSPLI